MTGPHGLRRQPAPPPRPQTFEDAAASPPSERMRTETPRAPEAARAPIQPKRGTAFETYAFPVFLLLIVVALCAGWLMRDRLQIESEEGVGYWLGVAGVVCVGILLIYPIRKRIPGLRVIGSVPAWFHFHMALGLLAPTLILFHAGFRTGSTNAAIALTAMLVVAGSGLLGRMLYVRIHRILTGKRNEVRAMAQDAGLLKQTMVSEFAEVAEISERLEATLHKPRPNVFSAFGYAVATSARITVARRQMLMALRRGARRLAAHRQPGAKAAARRLRRDGTILVKTYCRQLRHAAYLTFFERLFALWHIIHMPLFLLMVVAAVIHVVAVHLY